VVPGFERQPAERNHNSPLRRRAPLTNEHSPGTDPASGQTLLSLQDALSARPHNSALLPREVLPGSLPRRAPGNDCQAGCRLLRSEPGEGCQAQRRLQRGAPGQYCRAAGSLPCRQPGQDCQKQRPLLRSKPPKNPQAQRSLPGGKPGEDSQTTRRLLCSKPGENCPAKSRLPRRSPLKPCTSKAALLNRCPPLTRFTLLYTVGHSDDGLRTQAPTHSFCHLTHHGRI
jgi:hypothetical protein